MRVRELIAKLQDMPQDAQVLTVVQGDYADSPDVDVYWARCKDPSTGWWGLFYGTGSPKFSMGYEEVVVIT